MINRLDCFLKKARQVHGDKYDYSLVQYKNCKTKVQIVCPIHGVFEQTPDHHLNGKCGCPVCAGNQRSDLDTFIEKAEMVHGMLYDYSCVKYYNCHTKVAIICRAHGVFYQTPNNHLLGKGCPYCADNVKLTTGQFQQRSIAVHGLKYDYSLVVYKGNKIPVLIICPEHGVFKQTPTSHLSGNGCPICGLLTAKSHRNKAEIYNRVRKTMLSRYGVVNPMQVNEFRQKQLHAVQSADVLAKRIETKRRNRSFNTSKPECRLYEMLCDVFGESDVFDNYVSDLYPYRCDFYVESRNLYIELNAHWTHGGHWYDSDMDAKLVSDWRLKSTYYQVAADVFSKRDVDKRAIARENTLNYVVFWKADLSDAKLWFDLGCPDGQDWDKEYSWMFSV